MSNCLLPYLMTIEAEHLNQLPMRDGIKNTTNIGYIPFQKKSVKPDYDLTWKEHW